MFGPSLLVAPVIRPLAEIGRGRKPRFSVYLPPGEWFDYWTGRLCRGPAVVEAAAPLDILPLFVRAGAIVPMIRAADRIPEGRVDPLEVVLYPRGKSFCTLIEEAGRTAFRLEPAKGGYTLEWSGPLARKLVVRFGRGLRPERAPFRKRVVLAGPAKSGRLRLPAPVTSR
jgi:alpha-glucosidase (family GH31 glycosyl hydrolase)